MEAFKALRAWDKITTQQEMVLRRAGRDASLARPKSWQIEYAVQAAMIEAGCPPHVIRLGVFDGPEHQSFRHAKPLPEVDPGPIPIEEPEA